MKYLVLLGLIVLSACDTRSQRLTVDVGARGAYPNVYTVRVPHSYGKLVGCHADHGITCAFQNDSTGTVIFTEIPFNTDSIVRVP
jgi:hypothetical protein